MFLILALMLAAEMPAAAQKAAAVGAQGAARLASLAEVPGLVRGSEPAAYRAADRSVTNWQREAVRALTPALPATAAALPDLEGRAVTRCVRLNNYWCIKSARWDGEIGTDDEGHVGFASAERGADAAAGLLRRYYVGFGRRSALDIVRRWAPAECRLSTVGNGAGPAAVVAVRGIGNTLRARWLAAHRGRKLRATKPAPPTATTTSPAPTRPLAAQPRPARAGRVSVVPLRPLPTFRVPDIALGMGERPAKAAANVPRSQAGTRSASVTRAKPASPAVRTASPPPTRSAGPAANAGPVRIAAIGPALALPKPAPVLACASDEQRIRNYATRIAAAVAMQPDQDLDLFDAEGKPRPNLAAVMLAMSGFELGALRASSALIRGAVDRLSERQVADAARTAAPLP